MELEEKIKLLRTKNAEVYSLKDEIFNLSKDVFDDWCKNIFEKYPKIESFGWNQYTPYFNDGDTCTFSANTDYLSVNGEYADDAEWSNEVNVTNWGTYNREKKVYEGRVEVKNEKYDKDLDVAASEIRKFLMTFDDDFFMSRFGDHSDITVTKEGIEVDDYDHD